jgi:Holliday junction resolvase
VEGRVLKVLWTFETMAKAEPFIAILQEKEIQFEIQSKVGTKTQSNETTISVEEAEYEKAKRFLTRHRRRKTSS